MDVVHAELQGGFAIGTASDVNIQGRVEPPLLVDAAPADPNPPGAIA
jgi:hypothetical protein